MKNRTYVFSLGQDLADQIAVELWEDGTVQVMVREDSSAVWSPKLELLRESGDPLLGIFFERDIPSVNPTLLIELERGSDDKGVV